MNEVPSATRKQGSGVEPWLRGTHTDIQPVLRAVLHALELAEEDAFRWTAELTIEELHARPLGLPSLAFQVRHIGRSLDRLCTYLDGRQLSAEQMEQLRSEHETSESAASLRAAFVSALHLAIDRVLRVKVDRLDEQRTVGRAYLPTTVAGLLIHMAEHTQRHSGQMVTTAKVLLAMRDKQMS